MSTVGTTRIDLEAAGAALAAEAARFASFGWMRGTAGNLSVVVGRDPLRLAVTASGIDKGDLTAADVVLVDADGRAVRGGRPSAEAALHARIAARTGAGAVVHVHTVASVAVSHRHPEGIVFHDLEMLKGVGRPAEDEHVLLPVIPNSQDMSKLAGHFDTARNPDVPAVLVAAHGLYAWGPDLAAARHHTETVEWLLEFHQAVYASA
ncbi:methylthioribulose 1-phosphate dehydratase [Actinoplanes sp. NPDC051411]|uniref:methylthioribulose 1-phosphate dehydratase n=1 Tax=Actinoplanes sp. NPDC051411 TaxID=3155522 RepID=UPI003449A306